LVTPADFFSVVRDRVSTQNGVKTTAHCLNPLREVTALPASTSWIKELRLYGRGWEVMKGRGSDGRD